MNKTINRIPGLDGLRAVSIALVVFSHIFGEYRTFIQTSGNLGVRVFFVISGFLITTILVGEIEKTSTISLKKFYFRRTLRIFPAYYFYIFVILALTVLGFYTIPASAFLTPLIYTSNYFFPNVWELGHTWSLAVEEQFYLLFPGILLILGVNRTKKLLLFVIIIAPLIRFMNPIFQQWANGFNTSDWSTFGFHVNMDALASGCLLALCRSDLHESKFYKEFLQSRIWFVLLPVIIALITFYTPSILDLITIGITVMNVSIALSIDWLIVNSQRAVGKILNSAPFVFVGTLSYSIYLWQQPFTKYAEDKVWTHFPLNIVLLMLFSLFSYFVIEKTFLRLRQNMEKTIFAEKRKRTLLQTYDG